LNGFATAAFLPGELAALVTMRVTPGDFDRDGDVDLFALANDGAHRIYSNAGPSGGAFTLHAEQLAADGACGAAAGSFSVDGRIDVAVVGVDGVAVFLNDGAGNLGRGDTDAPTIALRGLRDVTVALRDVYEDAGATATDAMDGDVTDRIRVSSSVDSGTIGVYTVTYDATDLSGNSAAPVTRTVRVEAASWTGGGGGGGAMGCEALLYLALAALMNRMRSHHRGARRA
jgi:hypothetical protein